MASAARVLPRALIGKPLRSDRLEQTLLPKRLALPVFCSDPLSSVAYATEQILLVLGLGGLALLDLTPWVALIVVVLLAIVVASYRQTCRAYPNGGGAYAVSRANLGENASLTAASALLIDYVLTVAVSVVAGVAAITSAVPSLGPHAVQLSLGFVLLLTVMNLRGVKESGRAFAVPTYRMARAGGARPHEGKLVPQRQLLQEVWGPNYETETNYLRVYLAQLRRKLEPDPSHPRYLITEPGIGYRFVMESMSRD
jgi:hypothetical protein